MDTTSNTNERPFRQIKQAAEQLRAEGNAGDAFELMLAALRASLQENARLALLIQKLRQARAGKSASEKLEAQQLQLLFQLLAEEEEEELDIEAEAAADAELDKELEQAQQHSDENKGGVETKKRRRNQALKTPGLEERHTYLAVPKEQASWEVVGETLTERLRFSPAHFFKEVIHQPIVRAPAPPEDGSFGDVAVPAPASIVPDGMPGNDVVAMLLLRKFAEHSTLYRLHQQFLREQAIDIPRSTLGDWVAWAGRALSRLVPALLERATRAFLVGTDATGLRVLDSGPDHVHRGTFHLYRGTSGESDEADIVFVYTPTGQAQTGPWRVLQGRSGYLQADASNSFDRLFNGKVASAIEVGCHFHARRPFKQHDDDPRSAYVLQLVARLFKLEKLADARGLNWGQRAKLRQKRAGPSLEKLKRYLASLIRNGTPDEPLVKGAQYYINHWEALIRFLEDGRLPLTNNAVEYEFRAVRIGERNYLFAGSDEAAQRAAAIYSILATAKAYGLNLYVYLTDILDRLSYPMSQDQVAELLPHRWKQRHPTAGDETAAAEVDE